MVRRGHGGFSSIESSPTTIWVVPMTSWARAGIMFSTSSMMAL